MIFSLVHFDIHNVYISCKNYNIYIYIFMDGAVVDGKYVNVWTRLRGRIFVDEVFNLTRVS